MATRFLAISHSPIIMIRARAPVEEPLLLDHLQRGRDMVAAFDPELIIFFGTDHFAGFHLSLMPSMCIGLGDCVAVDDVGGKPGRLAVDKESALALVEHLRDQGFDPATSRKMRVDHAFSQPLYRLFGRHDRYPIVPIFLSVLTEPFAPFKRSRLLGEAIGRYAAASGRRILIMGTGGLSHHPTRYFPLPEDAEPDVYAYQLDGDRGGGAFDDPTWFKRLLEMHIEGADMLISGKRTAKDIHLNPDFDRRFLAGLEAGELTIFDDWGRREMIDEAGVGFMECHTWIAAAAADRAAGDTLPMTTVYAPTLEYGIGYGMAYTGG
jgi:2,3-dihydroxyphenylpropionate 1,2-dioxygenase